MDALDKIIAEKRAERDALLEKARLLDAEVSALELAAELRPATTPSRAGKRAGVTGRKGGGRKPGDISHAWREILMSVYQASAPHSYDEISAVAAGRGNDLAMSSVRDRVRNLVQTGLMAGDARDGFTVTQDAAERFGFAKKNDPPEGGSDTGEGGASPEMSPDIRRMMGLETAPEGADPALFGRRQGG